MRTRFSHLQQDDTGIDMTPMLDIVFIMLIFFIVTTSFVKESGIEINRPMAKTSEQQDDSHIMLAISPDGEIWIDKRLVELAAVHVHIKRLRTESPEGKVVIQSDSAASAGTLVLVMDQLRLAGVNDFAIATEEEE